MNGGASTHAYARVRDDEHVDDERVEEREEYALSPTSGAPRRSSWPHPSAHDHAHDHAHARDHHHHLPRDNSRSSARVRSRTPNHTRSINAPHDSSFVSTRDAASTSSFLADPAHPPPQLAHQQHAQHHHPHPPPHAHVPPSAQPQPHHPTNGAPHTHGYAPQYPQSQHPHPQHPHPYHHHSNGHPQHVHAQHGPPYAPQGHPAHAARSHTPSHPYRGSGGGNGNMSGSSDGANGYDYTASLDIGTPSKGPLHHPQYHHHQQHQQHPHYPHPHLPPHRSSVAYGAPPPSSSSSYVPSHHREPSHPLVRALSRLFPCGARAGATGGASGSSTASIQRRMLLALAICAAFSLFIGLNTTLFAPSDLAPPVSPPTLTIDDASGSFILRTQKNLRGIDDVGDDATADPSETNPGVPAVAPLPSPEGAPITPPAIASQLDSPATDTSDLSITLPAPTTRLLAASTTTTTASPVRESVELSHSRIRMVDGFDFDQIDALGPPQHVELAQPGAFATLYTLRSVAPPPSSPSPTSAPAAAAAVTPLTFLHEHAHVLSSGDPPMDRPSSTLLASQSPAQVHVGLTTAGSLEYSLVIDGAPWILPSTLDTSVRGVSCTIRWATSSSARLWVSHQRGVSLWRPLPGGEHEFVASSFAALRVWCGASGDSAASSAECKQCPLMTEFRLYDNSVMAVRSLVRPELELDIDAGSAVAAAERLPLRTEGGDVRFAPVTLLMNMSLAPQYLVTPADGSQQQPQQYVAQARTSETLAKCWLSDMEEPYEAHPCSFIRPADMMTPVTADLRGGAPGHQIVSVLQAGGVSFLRSTVASMGETDVISSSPTTFASSSVLAPTTAAMLRATVQSNSPFASLRITSIGDAQLFADTNARALADTDPALEWSAEWSSLVTPTSWNVIVPASNLAALYDRNVIVPLLCPPPTDDTARQLGLRAASREWLTARSSGAASPTRRRFHRRLRRRLLELSEEEMEMERMRMLDALGDANEAIAQKELSAQLEAIAAAGDVAVVDGSNAPSNVPSPNAAGGGGGDAKTAKSATGRPKAVKSTTGKPKTGASSKSTTGKPKAPSKPATDKSGGAKSGTPKPSSVKATTGKPKPPKSASGKPATTKAAIATPPTKTTTTTKAVKAVSSAKSVTASSKKPRAGAGATASLPSPTNKPSSTPKKSNSADATAPSASTARRSSKRAGASRLKDRLGVSGGGQRRDATSSDASKAAAAASTTARPKRNAAARSRKATTAASRPASLSPFHSQALPSDDEESPSRATLSNASPSKASPSSATAGGVTARPKSRRGASHANKTSSTPADAREPPNHVHAENSYKYELAAQPDPLPQNVVWRLARAIPHGKSVRLLPRAWDTTTVQRMINWAASENYQIMHLDAGWYGNEYDRASSATAVLGKYAPQLDLRKVADYGARGHVALTVYVNDMALVATSDLVRIYGTATDSSWHLGGVKFGFVDTVSPRAMRTLHERIVAFARAGLAVNVHDLYRPRGWSRTVPHLLTQEGIRGDEKLPDAFHHTVLPFVRMMQGAADYTPRYTGFDRIRCTNAHQLALPFVLFSPVQSLYWVEGEFAVMRAREHYPELVVWAMMPTVWHESRVVDGDIGEFAVLARRAGLDWFVGAVSNAVTRTVTIDVRSLLRAGPESALASRPLPPLAMGSTASEAAHVAFGWDTTNSSALSAELVATFFDVRVQMEGVGGGSDGTVRTVHVLIPRRYYVHVFIDDPATARQSSRPPSSDKDVGLASHVRAVRSRVLLVTLDEETLQGWARIAATHVAEQVGVSGGGDGGSGSEMDVSVESMHPPVASSATQSSFAGLWDNAMRVRWKHAQDARAVAWHEQRQRQALWATSELATSSSSSQGPIETVTMDDLARVEVSLAAHGGAVLFVTPAIAQSRPRAPQVQPEL